MVNGVRLTSETERIYKAFAEYYTWLMFRGMEEWERWCALWKSTVKN
jgi:hypothetical protein